MTHPVTKKAENSWDEPMLCLHITVLIWVFRHFSLVKSAKKSKDECDGENGIYAQAKVSKMFFAENVVYHCMAFL